MKKVIGMVLFCLMASGSAMAFEKFDVDYGGAGKRIKVTKVDDSFISSETKYSKEDIGKGVYIRLISLEMNSNFPNATKIIRDRFESSGIHTVDKIEDADLALDFLVSGGVSDKSVETSAEQGATNADRALVNGSALVNTVNNVNPSNAMAAGIGGVAIGLAMLFSDTEDAMITSNSFLKPVSETKSNGKVWIKGTIGKEKANFLKFEYKREKLKEDNAPKVTDDTVLKMMVDQWIKRYIVQ